MWTKSSAHFVALPSYTTIRELVVISRPQSLCVTWFLLADDVVICRAWIQFPRTRFLAVCYRYIARLHSTASIQLHCSIAQDYYYKSHLCRMRRCPADGWSMFDCCVVTASIAMLGVQVPTMLISELEPTQPTCFFTGFGANHE
jgi:hypothetical protein